MIDGVRVAGEDGGLVHGPTLAIALRPTSLAYGGIIETLVILPTYQEASNIEEVLRRVRASVPSAMVLVVDDNSPDGTADLATAIGQELGGIDVIRRRAKLGLGTAYQAGFQVGLERGCDAVVEMDSDLSHDPAVLPAILRPLCEGADVVIGSRYVPGGEIPNWSWRRRLLSRVGNRYAAAVLGLTVRDTTSGYRSYRTEVLRRLDLGALRASGYGFQIEMVYKLAGLGCSVVEVPIVFTDRVRGESKMSARITGEALGLVTWWGLRDRLLRAVRHKKDAPRE